MEGYIKLYRKLLENPIVCKDGDYLAVWIYILLNATHKEMPSIFKGNKIILKPGQLLTGRKAIGAKLKISESKVHRILKCYESEHMIEQHTSNQNRLVTVLNWELYQGSEQQNEQQMNNQRTTSEQRVNTNKNDKNDKNVNKDIYIVLFEFWNSQNIIVHKKLTDKMKTKLKSALKNYSEDDIKKAISNYSTILHSDEYYWTYKWTLEEFLQRGLERFMTDACFENYLKKTEQRDKPSKTTGNIFLEDDV